MSPTNWQDGGGGYPPGSDTPNAPWNQPDLEVTEEHQQAATKEVWFLLEWGSNKNPDIQFYDMWDMLENVCPRKYYDNDFQYLLDEMEITFERRGLIPALNLMPEKRREEIKTFAEAWVQERAEERAAFPGMFE